MHPFPLRCGVLCAVLVCIGGIPTAKAQDGTYEAIVTTPSGSYSVPVEVEDGSVTQVHWPNGGDVNVDGADLDGTGASGTDSRGDRVDIEIEDPAYDAGDA